MTTLLAHRLCPEVFPLLLVFALLAGCASGPVKNAQLEEARWIYKQTSTSSRVINYAPLALHKAEQALQAAERAWVRDGSPTVIDHLAFIAIKRTELAQVKAESAYNAHQLREITEGVWIHRLEDAAPPTGFR